MLHEESFNTELRIDNYNSDHDPFSLEGSLMYDQEASCISDRYKEAHLIQNSVIIRMLTNNNKNSVILDFGCGTGSDGLEILTEISNAIYVGLDSSEYMLKIALKKFDNNKLKSRSFFLRSDFRDLTTDLLIAELGLAMINQEISCIISSLVLHHYNTETRLRFYDLVRSLLKNGGVFVLTDLFSNSVSICNQIALDQELQDISKTIIKLEKNGLKQSFDTTISKHHYLHANQPVSLLNESFILTNCGFKNVDIVYRHGQLGVLVIKK